MSTQPLPQKQSYDVRRILLADDNSVSRKVAVRIFTDLGYQVEAVSNGADALSAAQKNRYDLIVLDTNLPEMDGYAVTREIRRLADQDTRRVPVIALTSGSSQRDRELREAAGIDDYLTKPLRVSSVAGVFSRWDKLSRAVAPPMSIDRDVLYSCLSVFGYQNLTALQELLELFLGAVPPRLSELRQAFDRGDGKTLGMIVHSLRGSCAQVGAMGMAQTCASIETLSHTDSMSGVSGLLDQIDVEFERVRQDLQTHIREGLGDRRTRNAAARMTLDLVALHGALDGKRLVAYHADVEVGNKLDKAFAEIGYRIEHVSDPAAVGTADLLFWQGSLESLGKLRQEGMRAPVIVLAKNPAVTQLEKLSALDADFVGEPFSPEDLQLRTLLRLNREEGSREPSATATVTGSVLVAEDDPLIARFLVSNLEGSGFQVTLVTDGDAALEALGQERFGVVILDINMPKTDGFGVLSQLRLSPENRTVPVIMLSSRTKEHDIVKAFDLGADDYVTKPFNPLELVFRARRLMRRN